MRGRPSLDARSGSSSAHLTMNLKPKGSHAKPYQVKQIRQVILRYKLGGDVNE